MERFSIALLIVVISLVDCNDEIKYPSFTRMIVENCYLEPSINSPTELEGVPTNVTFQLFIDKFMQIDDVAGSLTLSLSLVFMWPVDCVLQLLNSNDNIYSHLKDRLNIFIQDGAIWTPKIYQMNSPTGKSIQAGEFERGVRFRPSIKQFFSYIYGSISSICDLDLWLFPFDIQNCTVELLMEPCDPYVNVELTQVFEDGWISTNSNWDFVRHSQWMEKEPLSGNCYIYNSFTMKRRYRYFLLNLFVPGALLTVLEFAAFFIEPNSYERSSYAATVMLAMFVVHSQILSYLPKTPRPMMATDYIIVEIFFGTFITVYAVFMAWMISKNENLKKHCRFFDRKYLTYHVVDFLIFFFLIILNITYNFYALFNFMENF